MDLKRDPARDSITDSPNQHRSPEKPEC